ncbi:uncharacterized protein LOC112156514 isoform X2 [Oryzias melastigma]|uniref:uncharacterized protein LOC112156514 isoform X2 n=1 Tax=Oryzias melastigma TaxID=30732 RepID=UPI000CF80AF9|nr:uncharacterized protein LOC112156514 isoform X2 [Oryzias melastigma]
MNWVGGSRNRLVMKNDAKKQREFFEKKKMEQKLKRLGVKLPNSSIGSNTSGSTDLMTLLIVNQIAAKKANPDPPKVTVFGSSKKSLKHRRNEAIVLPMSPGSPSKLCLTDSQPQYSFQGILTRKAGIQQGFKCGQLSPVLESAFSDNSASDYLPPRTDLASPSSSSSSLSSGRGRASSGIFRFQMNPQKESFSQAQIIPQRSPSPWENVQQSRQPRSMTEASCWSNTSEFPLFQIQTPAPVQGLFGSPEPVKAEGEVRRMDVDIFPTQPQEEGLDFTLNQGGSEHVTLEDVFQRFCQDDGGEDCHSGGVKTKIFLAEETSVRPSGLQTVPDSQYVVAEFYKDADLNSSPPGQTPHPASCCEYSPSCSCRGGYYSSDSNDDEQCCQQDSSSYMAQACCLNHLDQALRSPKLPQSRLPTPPASLNDDTKVLESLKTASKGQMIEIKSPPVCLSLEHSPPVKPCGCRKVQTQDAAAQTVSVCAPGSRDAATQCGSDGEAATSAFSLQQLDVGGVSGRRSKSQEALVEEKKAPIQEFHSVLGSNGFPQRPTNPFGDSLNMRGNEGRLLSHKEEKEFRVNPPPQEDTQLEEIADILLLLKQKK